MKINLLLVGVTITFLLALAKVTGVIAWSWWIVFLPTFVPLIIMILAMLFTFFIAACIVYDYSKNPHLYKRIENADGSVTYKKV